MSRREAISRFAVFLASSPLLRAQPVQRETHQRIPSLDEIADVFEFERLAHAKIPQDAYDYIAGGVESEYTLRRNEHAFDWVTLNSRVMTDVSSVHLSTEIFGDRIDCPILIAPTAAHQQLHREGELETYRGAAAAKTTMVVSHGSSYPLDRIAEAAEGRLWCQIYARPNLNGTRERVEAAMGIGCRAVCLTVDTKFGSLRERLLHDRNLTTRARPATPRSRRRRRGAQPNRDPYRLRRQDSPISWSTIETIHSWSRAPLLIKGILTSEDAQLAVEHGADGIVVSNHGGRSLAHSPSTVEVLPEIVEAVEGRIPILLDSGIRRGADILKALALGANAVLVGRPVLWGLGAFGAAGAQRALEILQAELAVAMAHSGCRRIADINRGLVETNFP